MLILRREEGESLVIDQKISVTILSIEPGGTVNIGINAPKDILILRSELQQAASANQDAAQAAQMVESPQLLKNLEYALLHSGSPGEPEHHN